MSLADKSKQIKELKAPCIMASGVKLKDYLIQYVGDDHVFIHRELQPDELDDYKDNAFMYKGKTYLAGIACCQSEEEAEKAVQGYWGAVFQRQNIKKNPANLEGYEED